MGRGILFLPKGLGMAMPREGKERNLPGPGVQEQHRVDVIWTVLYSSAIMNLGLDGHVSVHEHCSSYNYAWVSDFEGKKKVCELNLKGEKCFTLRNVSKWQKKSKNEKDKRKKYHSIAAVGSILLITLNRKCHAKAAYSVHRAPDYQMFLKQRYTTVLRHILTTRCSNCKVDCKL